MRFEIPLCFDHHNHFSLYRALAACPSLEGVHDRASALAVVAALPNDRPNLVTGWHSDRFAITRRELEGLPPVAILNSCLHGWIMNDAAAGMAADAGFPVEPSCALDAERLMPRVLSFFGGFVPLAPDASRAMVDRLRAAGLYGVEDMLYVAGPGRAGTGAVAGDRITTAQVDGDSFIVLPWAMPAAFVAASAAGVPGLRGIKLFTDGAVGARTAAISDGYVGGGEPVLTYSDDALREEIGAAFAVMPAGAGLAIHAIGDMAIGQVLGAVEAAAWMPGMPADLPSGVRIEHAQFITLSQAKLAREMGITLSMQPNFNSDSAVYLDRLDPATAAANNPFRMIIDDAGFTPGRDLLFGSDGMPHGMAAALKDALYPPHPSQRLSLDELLAGYSADRRRGTVSFEIDP